MPCNSDYLERSATEAYYQVTAQNLCYVYKMLGRVATKKMLDCASNYYGGGKGPHEEFVTELCELILGMSGSQMDSILYDGRSPDARKLADWWQKHLEADRRRIDEEMKRAEVKRQQESAMAKLTDEEKMALGLKP